MNWYEVKNINEIDSPALLIFPERIQENIDEMIAIVKGEKSRLMPHVKTHKMAEIIKMQIKSGIERFKCATIAELEMTLSAGAKFVLIAYQLTGPKIERFINLVKKYPEAKAFSLVDNLNSAKELAKKFKKENLIAQVYLDVNNGQNRTGCPIDENVFELYEAISKLKSLIIKGLHVYDGHIRDKNQEERKNHSDHDFYPIYHLIQQIESANLPKPEIITGGSPSFLPAALRSSVFCSPGTVLLWDWGYADLVENSNFQWAAILLTRIISKPQKNLITTDLGHKSVAAENPIEKRVKFLNLENYEVIGQSEEHLVLKVENWEKLQVGDVLYGVPYHVCPTVALHDFAAVIRKNKWAETWEIIARRRKINF